MLTVVPFAQSLDVRVGLAACPECANYFQADPEDATPAIQTAMTTLRVNGGTIQIDEGTYILGKNVEFYSKTTVQGAGMDKTVLKLKDAALPWKTSKGQKAGFLRATYQTTKSCSDIKVAGMTLDGNKQKQNTDSDSKYGRYGLFTEGCTNALFDDVRIVNWQGYGFDPHGWKTGNVYGYNLNITNCIANDNDWDGFTLDQTSYINVSNCTAYNNGRHGFNIVTGSDHVVLTNITSENNGYYYYTGTSGCGVVFQNNMQFGTNTVRVERSKMKGDKKGGVCVNDVFVVDIVDNVITTPNKCIELTSAKDVLITGNTCTTPTKRFISSSTTYPSVNVTVTNNTLTWL